MEDGEEMNHKTNKKHFDLFKKECDKWLNFFSMKQWRIFYEHKDYEHVNGYGCYSVEHEGKIATIGLCINWGDTEPKNQYIKRTAFHEVCELLLSPLNWLAKSRFGVLEEDLNERRHEIIRVLENKIFMEK